MTAHPSYRCLSFPREQTSHADVSADGKSHEHPQILMSNMSLTISARPVCTTCSCFLPELLHRDEVKR